jgi:hypothetical protein
LKFEMEIESTRKRVDEALSNSLQKNEEAAAVSNNTIQSGLQKIETETEAYGKRLSQAGHFEEELDLARLIVALTKYPEKAKEVPTSRALVFVTAVRNLCLAKGFDPLIRPGAIPINLSTITLQDCLNYSKDCLEREVLPS